MPLTCISSPIKGSERTDTQQKKHLIGPFASPLGCSVLEKNRADCRVSTFQTRRLRHGGRSQKLSQGDSEGNNWGNPRVWSLIPNQGSPYPENTPMFDVTCIRWGLRLKGKEEKVERVTCPRRPLSPVTPSPSLSSGLERVSPLDSLADEVQLPVQVKVLRVIH